MALKVTGDATLEGWDGWVYSEPVFGSVCMY